MTRSTMNTFMLPSSAMPDTPSATSCVTSFTGSSLTRPSFTCHLREGVAWVPPLTNYGPSSAAPNTASVKSCVTSSATSCAKSFTCVLHGPSKGKRGEHACVWRGFCAGRWQKERHASPAPSSTAPGFRRLKVTRATMAPPTVF